MPSNYLGGNLGLLLFCRLLLTDLAASEPICIFPGTHWETRDAETLVSRREDLDRYATHVGGDGCVIRNGFLVYQWGEMTRHKDWASAAKPVLSTLLMMAVQEGKLKSVDARVAPLGWELSEKDASMTFRHLANMVSGYALEEVPGAAWGYNDFAIQLYVRSLERVYGQPLDAVIRQRLSMLQFEDGEFFGSRSGGGVTASSRDFARVGWLWLNQGEWNGQTVIDPEIFADCVRVGVPKELPQAVHQSNDYLSIGSYGGGTTQTPLGPGCYGFNFWFNELLSSRQRVWPALPADTYQANGLWNRDTITVIPSLNIVIAARGSKPGKFQPGAIEGEYNQNLSLLMKGIMGAPLARSSSKQ